MPGAEPLVREWKQRLLRAGGALPSLGDVSDIHVVCGVLKDFLRGLKEPLVTFSLHPAFLRAAGERGDEQGLGVGFGADPRLKPRCHRRHPRRDRLQHGAAARGRQAAPSQQGHAGLPHAAPAQVRGSGGSVPTPLRPVAMGSPGDGLAGLGGTLPPSPLAGCRAAPTARWTSSTCPVSSAPRWWGTARPPPRHWPSWRTRRGRAR